MKFIANNANAVSNNEIEEFNIKTRNRTEQKKSISKNNIQVINIAT